MQILDILNSGQGGKALDNLARAYGLTPRQAEAVVSAVLPEVARSIERNTLSRGGLADMVAAMGTASRSPVLSDAAALASPAVQQQGVALLDQILASKDRSRAVAARASAATGISEAIIKQMLPVIITMIVGALAKGGQGALGDIIARIPGLGGASGPEKPAQRPRAAPQPSPEPEMPTLPEPAPGGGGPLPLPGSAPMPQSSGGGFGTGGSMGSPLPLPGDDIPGLGRGSNPYGDLSDIIRRGGPVVAGGGGVAAIVRSILGSLLGFQSRGVMGWLIRLIVMRWGWGLLKTILGRLVLRR